MSYFQAFQPQPTVINLGSGTYFGAGDTQRNVNLGQAYNPAMTMPNPSTMPNPEYKNNPYGLQDDQALEKWGKSKKIVGKDASEGLKRNLQGLADFATFGVWDFDNRGNLGGGKHLPGLAGGSGYGGQAQLGNVPQTIANPQTPNVPLDGSPVPGNLNMGKYYANQAGVGVAGHLMGRQFTNQFLDDAYARSLQARQAADAQNVLLSTAMQRTDKGQSQRATEQQNRMLTAAQAKYLNRLGVAALSAESAKKAAIATGSRVGPGAFSTLNVGATSARV